ncbi:MAG: glycosyltransferase family 4 protein [Chloroflexota bacterium]|nr:glycosyltransferase family 4 protein [Chloroflexota bacterium]
MSKIRTKKTPTSIALVVNQNEIFYRLRMPWIKLLRQHGYTVYAVTTDDRWSKQIESGGATLIEWKLSRSGRNPITELRSLLALARILRRIKPDIVQNFHTKPNIYAPIAAKLAGVPITISTVTGLGYTFVERPGLAGRFAKRLTLAMYSFANRLANEVTFQNIEDMQLLKKSNGLSMSKGRFIPGGSGVELSKYHPDTRHSSKSKALRQSLGIAASDFVVMFVGRLQLDKGLVEFVEAARKIKSKREDIAFVMVGAPDPGNIRSLPESQLSQWKSEGEVIFTGRREDVPDLMAMANTITTPTFYREGLPRTLLEAAATGLPLIGTDMPGVREAISDGLNGILIPPQNSEALAEAVEELADDPEKSTRYGEFSLKRAVNEFDHRRVLMEYIRMYDEHWENK